MGARSESHVYTTVSRVSDNTGGSALWRANGLVTRNQGHASNSSNPRAVELHDGEADVLV